MNRITAAGKWAFVFCLLTALPAQAQPQAGEGGEMRSQWLVRRYLQVEQVLGYLALDDEIALTDQQMLNVRKELKAICGKRAALLKSAQQEDEDSLKEKVRVLRGEMADTLSGILNKAQTDLLNRYLSRLREAAGRSPGRGEGRP